MPLELVSIPSGYRCRPGSASEHDVSQCTCSQVCMEFVNLRTATQEGDACMHVHPSHTHAHTHTHTHTHTRVWPSISVRSSWLPPSQLQVQERLGDAIDKATGNLLYHMATRFKDSEKRTSFLLDYVCGKKICTELQITGALMTVCATAGTFNCCGLDKEVELKIAAQQNKHKFASAVCL